MSNYIDYYYIWCLYKGMNQIFMPIFKTKKTAELKAFEKCIQHFNKGVIPYLELMRLATGSKNTELKFLNMIGDRLHFVQYLRKDEALEAYLYSTSTLVRSKSRVYAIQICEGDLRDNYEIIEEFVHLLHERGDRVAIRIESATAINWVKSLFAILNSNDYLIFDFASNDFKSLRRYSEIVLSLSHMCSLIAFSDERPLKKPGRLFQDCDYNYDFNTSIIDSIKANHFGYCGFGSYCGSKNDLTEIPGNYPSIRGVFVIYNYENNSFFSIITDTSDHIARIYTELKNKIKLEKKDTIFKLFEDTPLSKKLLHKIIFEPRTKNVRCVEFLEVSIVHYIEEIVNNRSESVL
jgi:hypothetical protein